MENPSINLLKDLIGFNTSTGHSNLDLIAYVEKLLGSHDIDHQRIYSADKWKANLIATIGPSQNAGYIMSGHTDVVPADPKNWSSDPFKAEIRDEKIFGRGTADMKGFIAVILSKLPEMRAANLKVPLHIALSYDEEIGCIGVRDIIHHLNQAPARQLGSFVGEPSNMDVVIGHKGKRSYAVEITGRTGHSSLTANGVNAIEFAARLIAHIRDIADSLKTSGPFDPLFDVAHSTAQTGVISGGQQVNIIPDSCRFEFEFRFIGADKGDDLVDRVKDYAENKLIPEMRVIAQEARIEFTPDIAYEDLDMNENDPFISLTKSIAQKNSVSKVSYGAEAGLFARLGNIPSVICGPGDISQAHQPDEYVSLEQLQQCGLFIDRLIRHCEE
ncbi:MAG: acetylornithine deacetylase [Rhizobiaceae bacterium]